MYQFIGVSLILSLFMFNMSSCTIEDELQPMSADLVDDEVNSLDAGPDWPFGPDGPGTFGHQGFYTNVTCGSPTDGTLLNFEEFFDNYEQCQCFTQQWLANCSTVWPPLGQICKSVTRPEVPYGAFCGN